jgi:photosystem II stability/assembly factor-like uncharacterized protein
VKSICISVLVALAMSLALPMPVSAASASIPRKGGIGSPGPSAGTGAGRTLVTTPVAPPQGMPESTAAIRAIHSVAGPRLSPAPTVGGTWQELGPRPAVNLDYAQNGTVVSQFGNVSGRVDALAVDPTNPNVVYAGAAGGGVWKTVDGGANWVPLTDSQPSLVISSLAIDPNDHLVIYAGTGDRDGLDMYGNGVLKSTDGGSHWLQLGAAAFGGASIGSIAIDRATHGATQHVSAATDFGLLQSVDGGATWTQNMQIKTVILGAPTVSGGLFQVIQDPTTATRFFATAADDCRTEIGQVLVSNDRGSTWSVSNNFLNLANPASRVQLGVGPGGVDYVVTVQCAPSEGLYDVEKTVDGGAHWNVVPNVPDYLTSPAGGQGQYDNYVGVDPNNAARVIFGGIDVLAQPTEP